MWPQEHQPSPWAGRRGSGGPQHQPFQWHFQFQLHSPLPWHCPQPSVTPLACPSPLSPTPLWGSCSIPDPSPGARGSPVPQPCPGLGSHHPCSLPGLGDVSGGRRALPCCSGSPESPKDSLDRSFPPLHVAATVPALCRGTEVQTERPHGCSSLSPGYQRGQVLLAPPCLVPGPALQPMQEDLGSSQGSAGAV